MGHAQKSPFYFHNGRSPYLYRRGGTYWFRKVVPDRLVDVFGSKDVRRWLRTRNLRIARRRALDVVCIVEQAFEAIERTGISPDAARSFAQILDNVLADFDPYGQRAIPRSKYETVIRQLEKLSSDDIKASGSTELAPRAMQSTDGGAGQPTGVDVNDLRLIVADELAKSKRRPGGDVILSSYLKDFFDFRRKTGGLSAKHLDESMARIQTFVETVGDKPVDSYTFADVEAYRDLLDQLPSNAFKRFKTSDIREAIAVNARRREPFEVMSPITVDAKWLNPIQILFKWLHEIRAVIPSNPTMGVGSFRRKQDTEDKRQDEVRLPLTPKDLKAVQALSKKRPETSIDRWALFILLCYRTAIGRVRSTDRL
ncbi:MAG: DUF6538 domain-containing protein [Pseudomonadota bacterium]